MQESFIGKDQKKFDNWKEEQQSNSIWSCS